MSDLSLLRVMIWTFVTVFLDKEIGDKIMYHPHYSLEERNVTWT